MPFIICRYFSRSGDICAQIPCTDARTHRRTHEHSENIMPAAALRWQRHNKYIKGAAKKSLGI